MDEHIIDLLEANPSIEPEELGAMLDDATNRSAWTDLERQERGRAIRALFALPKGKEAYRKERRAKLA